MYRKIEARLNQWKHQEHRRPLMIKGARQVGKTYTIMKFAKAHYKNVIMINLELEDDIRKLFEQSIKPQDFINLLELRDSFSEKPDDTLIFLDEIQASPRAITALKFLATDCPYDIIASGSMLGVAIAVSTSYPVGYVETMDMKPMDFEEFLYANGIKETQIDTLREQFLHKEPLLESMHHIYMEYLRKYIVVGGMPAIVKEYITTHSFQNVRKMQVQIMDDYYRDMAKYALPSEKLKVHQCFQSIPLQLAKENKKFQYKLVKQGGNARFFEDSLAWLKDSGLIYPCTRVKCIKEPLEAYREIHIFKVYMFDTGLLISQFDPSCAAHILQDDPLIYKGAIYENLAAQMLSANGHQLFYFEPSSRNEIDFLLMKEGNIIPLEIKASDNTKAKSLQAYVDKYHPAYAYKFTGKNTHMISAIESYPLYMLMFL